MPPSKRIPHDDPRWTQRKAAIRQMKVDGKTQLHMRQKLEDDGFSVTKAELEAQLQFWGFRTRVPKNKGNAVWQYTDHHLSKRERAGKRSVVYHDGKLVGSVRLEKERKRHQPSSFTKYTTVSSPKTPTGVLISICSPTAVPIQLRWPNTLPWLRFQDNEKYISSLSYEIIKSQPVHRGDLNSLGLNLAPYHIGVAGNLSDFAASLASMMPEYDEYEITNRAQLIMQGSATQAFVEYVKVILYGLSNNIIPPGTSDFFKDAEVRRWGLIINSIARSGITNETIDLAHTNDLTLASIAENLLKTCVYFRVGAFRDDESTQTSNDKIITWLLNSGQDPNISIHISYEIMLLEYAMLHCDVELAIQLLDAGANPTSCAGPSDSPLLFLLQDECKKFSELTPKEQKTCQNLVRRFLEAGASLHEGQAETRSPSALMLAVLLDSQIADILIQHKASIRHRSSDDQWLDGHQSEFCRTRSVLGFAACNEIEERAIENVQHLLDQAGRSDPPIPAADLIDADVLCNAASRGFDKLIALCCSIDSSTAVTRDELFPALCAASFYGHQKTCELLIQYGAPVNGPEGLEAAVPCPIHFAALSDSCGVVEILCQHGANVNAEFTFEKYDRRHNLWSRVIGSPTLMNRVYRKFGGNTAVRKIQIPCTSVNSLGAAIFGAGDTVPSTFPVLLHHGSRLPPWAVYYGACGRPDPWLIRSAVDEGVNLNWQEPGGKTALHAALVALSPPISDRRHKPLINSEDDCLSVIKSLVYAGADTAGNEPLIAVLLRLWDFFDEVSPQGLTHDTRHTTYQMSMLAAVVLTRSPSTIQRVLSQAPVAYDHGALCASVMLAISSDRIYPLQQLLGNYDWHADFQDFDGLSLGLAAWYNRTDILDMLLSKVQSSTSSLLPVHVLDPAAYEIELPPREEEIEAILSDSFEGMIPFWHRKPEPGVHLVRGSPLILALWSGSCLDQLVQKDCYPDRLTMSTAVFNCNIDVLEKLVNLPRLDNGHADRPGPLFLSVEYGEADKMRLLLEAGEDPDEDNHLVRFGRNPLQKAVEDGNLEAMDLLLKHSASVNAPAAAFGGATALQLATIKGRIGVAQYLLNLGADVNAPGAVERGRTALEGAAENGRLDMVQFLLDQGASLTGHGQLQYFRAIEFAQRNYHLVVANTLRDYRQWTDWDHYLKGKVQELDFGNLSELTSLDKLMNSSDSGDSTSQSSYVSQDGSERDSLEENGGSAEPQEHSMDFIDAGNDDVMLEKQWASNNDFETSWNQHSGGMDHQSQDSQKAMSPMFLHPEHYTTVEEQEVPGFGAEVSWNQQFKTASWYDSRGTAATEKESGTSYEIIDGDMDWSEAQHVESHPIDMNWLASQSVMPVERETGVCYEMPEEDTSLLETQDDWGQIFDMNWSR